MDSLVSNTTFLKGVFLSTSDFLKSLLSSLDIVFPTRIREHFDIFQTISPKKDANKCITLRKNTNGKGPF